MEITKQLMGVEEESVIDLDFVEVLSRGHLQVSPKSKDRIARVRKELGQDFFPKLIWTITKKSYDPSEAKKLWDGIIRHKKRLDNELGRDVGISVATLDYMSNIQHKLSKPILMETGNIEKIAESALVDELTGLYVRTVFDVSIDKNISEYKRYESPVSLIMADIDDFKEVNDRYGHQKGDEVLESIGKILNKNARDPDIAVRYGGEEFAIILPQTDEESAYNSAERLRISVCESFKNYLSVTISLGVANCPQHATFADGLVKAADDALYSAKARGKNQVVIAGKKELALGF